MLCKWKQPPAFSLLECVLCDIFSDHRDGLYSVHSGYLIPFGNQLFAKMGYLVPWMQPKVMKWNNVNYYFIANGEWVMSACFICYRYFKLTIRNMHRIYSFLEFFF